MIPYAIGILLKLICPTILIIFWIRVITPIVSSCGIISIPKVIFTIEISNWRYVVYEIVVVNDQKDRLNNSHFSKYLPRRLIYRWNDSNISDGRPRWNVLEGRTDHLDATVYICKGMSCSLPITSDAEVVKELARKVFS